MRSRLTQCVIEIEKHAATGGWDQPLRLYALVETADLLRREPHLADQLGLPPDGPALAGHLTPVEQEELPSYASLDELLSGLAWPAEVLGAALVVERLMLPPGVEGAMPQGEEEALAWVAAHPERQEVRIAVGVLRDGTRECALRMRAHDADTSVLSGPDLVPGLADALEATLAD